MDSEFDPDLLQPSLDASHDAVGFEKPWDPKSLIFAAFFCGPIGGGALFAWNFKRLGQAKAATHCALAFALLALGLAALWALLLPEFTSGNQRRLFRYGLQALTVVAGFVAARTQRRRFRVFLGHGGDSKGLLPYGIAAAILGSLAQWALFMGAVLLINGELPGPLVDE